MRFASQERQGVGVEQPQPAAGTLPLGLAGLGRGEAGRSRDRRYPKTRRQHFHQPRILFNGQDLAGLGQE